MDGQVEGASDRLQAAIQGFAEPLLADMGLELVEIQYRREGHGWVLRFFIDREGGVTIDDCAAASREIGARIEVEDLIDHAYTLEVSSPGLERLLKRAWTSPATRAGWRASAFARAAGRAAGASSAKRPGGGDESAGDGRGDGFEDNNIAKVRLTCCSCGGMGLAAAGPDTLGAAVNAGVGVEDDDGWNGKSRKTDSRPDLQGQGDRLVALISAIEDAVSAAVRKKYGSRREIEVQFNDELGEVEVSVPTVDEVLDEETEISLEDARKLIRVRVGRRCRRKARQYRRSRRIAAQSAKQVIIHRMRDAEPRRLSTTWARRLGMYRDREGSIVNGIVQRFGCEDMIINLGRTDAVLPWDAARFPSAPTSRATASAPTCRRCAATPARPAASATPS